MAYQTAKRANANDKIRIQRCYDKAEKALALHNQNSMEIDLELHLAIAEASHNRFFTQAMQTISIQVLDGMAKVSEYFIGNKARHHSIKSMEHSLILEAIMMSDAPMAKAAMELHLERSKNWIKASK